MLILFVLGVMFLVLALLFAMFSTFTPFIERFGDAMEYNTAYYGALSAVERGALALRYRGPGFDGKSGWTSSGDSLQELGTSSDNYLQDFYTYGKKENSLYWSIRSRTQQIPSLGEGNVEKIFIDAGDLSSYSYNSLNYTLSDLIPLGIDNTTDAQAYYRPGTNVFHALPGTTVDAWFRLNPYLTRLFGGSIVGNEGLLCLDGAHCNCDAGGLCDLPVVSWTLKGIFDGKQFTLLPTESIIRSSGPGSSSSSVVYEALDTFIRKKRVNESPLSPQSDFRLGDNSNPLQKNMAPELNIVSENEAAIRALNPTTYTQLLGDTRTERAVLNLSLVNYLISKRGALFPFLEYRLVSSTPISDRFFTLEGKGKVGAYDVTVRVKKPTLNQPTIGSFTIIF